jgi:hypothetical protein
MLHDVGKCFSSGVTKQVSYISFSATVPHHPRVEALRNPVICQTSKFVIPELIFECDL